MDVVVGMEDPFDDASLDTISLFEALDHVALVRMCGVYEDTGGDR